MKFLTRKKPEDETSFGPGGYTVFRVLIDSAGEVYYAPVADFKYRSDAKIFENQKNVKAVKKSKNKPFHDFFKAAMKPWWED